jgi:hypothetical protein
MRIALLGWGSLLWAPGELETVGKWHSDGPWLPIEFARVSGEKRLTLVLFEAAGLVRTYWAESASGNLDAARANLRLREKCQDVSHVAYIIRGRDVFHLPFAGLTARLHSWLEKNPQLDAVIWTDLRSNFEEKREEPYTVQAGLTYLKELSEQDAHHKAEEYIRKAPSQTDTCLRQRAREELGWADQLDSQ